MYSGADDIFPRSQKRRGDEGECRLIFLLSFFHYFPSPFRNYHNIGMPFKKHNTFGCGSGVRSDSTQECEDERGFSILHFRQWICETLYSNCLDSKKTNYFPRQKLNGSAAKGVREKHTSKRIHMSIRRIRRVEGFHIDF